MITTLPIRTDIDSKRKLIDILYGSGAISFPLQSIDTPYQINFQSLTSQPRMLRFVARLIGDLIKNQTFDLIAGPYTDIPLATTVSLEYNYPMIFVRKERKQYGREKLVEGSFKQDQKVIIVDDEISDIAATSQLLGRLEGSGLKVIGIYVLLDRGLGAIEKIEEEGYKCSSILTLNEAFVHLAQSGEINQGKLQELKKYIEEQRKELIFKTHPLKF
ncbi:MAG: hypothetical protein HY426_03785 [Candidatus Levybacteria bacterium]|nr:hypothetical protein [Candidatus Levybacteria bacterium]